ncbi:MAG TPA: gamma-glutamyl-gamma-aminobutyrate hydrolase family protein [Bacteroidales bacterium]|jgi:putative glutamine amidotransferase|nr:gamma-glutamyl-gamma-aminobutyrate hydrolase family protein [Bacteroidales bacterium]
MSVKKVLIVSRRYTRKNKLINWVSEIYLDILCQSGIMPIIVPIAHSTKNMLEYYMQDYDGLLMVEGGDLGPQYYNKKYNIEQLDEYDALKDTIEIACATHAISNNKPILGLCRGMHIINAMFGGTLHLDVHKCNENKVCHINYDNYDSHRHRITIEKNTPLFNWYQLQTLEVNTYHHQGIEKLAPSLTAMAYADDGLIEAIYHPNFSFIVGLQFHPERMYHEYEGNKLVFQKFIESL